MNSAPRNEALRAQLPLLDRLIDDAPNETIDPPLGAGEALIALRRSVQRDLEALLNARRCWRSWPTHLAELSLSSIGYGLPDFTTGALTDPTQRERLRAEIAATIGRFEPRLTALRVTVIEDPSTLEPRLRLRIDAVLHAEPAYEPVAFTTMLDTTTTEVTVREEKGGQDV